MNQFAGGCVNPVGVPALLLLGRGGGASGSLGHVSPSCDTCFVKAVVQA